MKRVVCWSIALYAAAHFLYSGGWWAQQGVVAGDIRTAFPGPLAFQAGQRWPLLKREWIVAPPPSAWQMSAARAGGLKPNGHAALPEADCGRWMT